MDNATTSERLRPYEAPQAPAFLGPRWNLWIFLIIALVCALGLVITQTIAVAIIIIKDHPELLSDPMARTVLNSRSFLLDLLSARNLWIVTAISDGTLALLTLGLARAAFGTSFGGFGLVPKPQTRFLVLGVGVGLLLTLVTALLEHLIEHFFGPHPQFAALALAKHRGIGDFVLDFMSVSLFAPIAEEVFFRGFIFAGLAQRMPVVLAAAISAALFSAAHFDLWSFVPIFAVGLGLATVYYTTRSLRANIVTHATFNTLSLVIAYLCPHCVQ